MPEWRSKIILRSGETLKHLGSSTKGFMGETDVDEYEVRFADQRIGTVSVSDHTAIKGFRRTISVVQKAADGTVIIDETWTA